MTLHGLDVSQYQGEINWSQVKKSGKAFAMIRLGWCGYDGTLVKDPTFEQNIAQAAAAGLETGVYLYSYGRTVPAMAAAARQALTELRGKPVTFPVALDFEDRIYQGNTRQMNNALVTAFLEAVQEGGYFAQLYTYAAFATAWLEMESLRAYSFWLADYSEKPVYTGPFAMWQYTGSGSVSGITGPVSLDVAYQDFAQIIRQAGLNRPQDQPEDPCARQTEALQRQLDQTRQRLDRLKAGLEQLLKEL